MDHLSQEQRSANMRAIQSKGMRPEMIVRRLTHRLGYRFRLHRKDLPGTPDLVFPRLRKIIFVHGCFWHKHNCKRGWRQPKANKEYWIEKISKNVCRDKQNIKELISQGWQVLIIWECQTKDIVTLSETITSFLSDD